MNNIPKVCVRTDGTLETGNLIQNYFNSLGLSTSGYFFDTQGGYFYAESGYVMYSLKIPSGYTEISIESLIAMGEKTETKEVQPSEVEQLKTENKEIRECLKDVQQYFSDGDSDDLEILANRIYNLLNEKK